MDWMMMWPGEGLEPWFQAWIENFVTFAAVPGVAALLVVGLLGWRASGLVRRRFWCPFAEREVEVEFRRRGWLRGPESVVACSAFECGEGIACRRRCLDVTVRRQWEPPLPIWAGHRRG
ncbi:MAG TPA: hypothetical protein VFL90_02005 [Methylomirabilota bacterium]|nr:hypothetical protein [Methylomirabilota bacterium]